ncbi:cyclin family protein [Peribacillus deserti]|uniref:Uncharacterized protein n=1 Tax=Peribacillus deserti TaxID=673318 RepID=A0A2N5M5K9_9BACI|nr:cyclin family protein [Peribacillus deserti]PLT29656.1 hypothetical protein CUU66_12185 [Peribacillus deserti]
MTHIGRNDPCGCGSGEKYKKCCGKGNVLSLSHTLEKELDEILLDMLGFAMNYYQHELERSLGTYYQAFNVPDRDKEIARVFGSIWFITSVELGDSTILSKYLDKQANRHRPRVKDILNKWKTVRPSVGVIEHQNSDQSIVVKDLFSNKVQNVKVLEEDLQVESGSLLLAAIFPAVENSIVLGPFIEVPPVISKQLEQAVISLYEGSEIGDPQEFMSELFLDVLNLFMSVFTEEGVWNSEAHKEVADHFLEFMMDQGRDDEAVLDLGVTLWGKYCSRKNPSIKKPEIYVAALIYLVDKLVPFGGYFTQKELAEQFRVSSASISSRFKEMQDALEAEVDQLQGLREKAELDVYREKFEHNVQSNPLIPKAALERELLQLQREINEQNFESMDQIQEFLTNRMNPKPAKKKLSKKERAQELLFDAYEAAGKKRVQLAKEALKLYPNSPDAFNILAESERNLEERLSLYKAGLEAGEKELGKSFFNQNKGHFWGLTETRPYMRVKFLYAALLQDMGMVKEAISQYEELLMLNPMDNQGVRYELFGAYVQSGHIQKANALLNEYKEDSTAHGAFNSLLIEYEINGITPKTKRLVKRAKDVNPYVIDYLTGSKQIPKQHVDSFIFGSESEAAAYVLEHRHLWERNKELVEWLRRQA